MGGQARSLLRYYELRRQLAVGSLHRARCLFESLQGFIGFGVDFRWLTCGVQQ